MARLAISPYALAGVGIILLYDIIWQGVTRLALCCPLWILVILLRCVIRRRACWSDGIHCALAACVFVASAANSGRVERLNEARVKCFEVALCGFKKATGKWPQTLDALVPQWLDDLPDPYGLPASRWYKYYFAGDHPPSIMWIDRAGSHQITWVQCQEP
jgi:hypothetical protein